MLLLLLQADGEMNMMHDYDTYTHATYTHHVFVYRGRRRGDDVTVSSAMTT